jgi:hypothetical protein
MPVGERAWGAHAPLPGSIATVKTNDGAATASYAGREAIREMFGDDLLADYQLKRMTADRIDDADLIIVMAASLLQKKLLPEEKTFVLRPFFVCRVTSKTMMRSYSID